ncbi:hypothetical protein HGRIS_000093 [Hohenbuehelia grisea]|uniref:Protein transport protein SEC31 n=1 Tax=Hohenbuehelia grisea TaxID=104357 RepID=A0ABR3JQ68_9AGAR
MKLKEIHRTSTFAWSPTPSVPLLATGTVAGALDESFSNESHLEIWAPDFLDKHEFDLGAEGQHGPKGHVADTARFNRLAWGFVDSTRPSGVIAAGMENGELALYDAAKILAGEETSETLILRNSIHTGPIRGLDFNPHQNNLLASGGVSGEVYIWDLKDPGKPYSPTPGSRSTKLDEITSVAWNQQVQSVLAGASSTGYTVVWDLRGKREVVALAYGGGAGTLAGQTGAGNGLAVGGRRGMSDIAWHPDNATRLVTASEDDTSPIIMVWDLRNARAPEKILTGHEKGVLSLSWCKQDADLLLSCGKDNRVLCWNPQSSEIIGELPSADNWGFQVDWCPRNPDMLATAFFDGTVGIHSIQTTNEAAALAAAAPVTDGSDIFDAPGFTRSSQGGTLSLKQPPKWLRRPASCSFGFGGKLVSVSNLPSAQGRNQSSVVHIRKVVTEDDLVERARQLQAAIAEDKLNEFAEAKTSGKTEEDGASWKALLSLFRANSRDELVTLLGFSKEEVAARVAEAIEKLKVASATPSTVEEDITDSAPPPVVSFTEPESTTDVDDEVEQGSDDENAGDKTPSEVSASVISDVSSAATRLADAESTTTTAPSLFGDDNGPADGEGGADFFNTLGVAQSNGRSGQVLVPHTNYGLDSSVAATVGSGPSSVTSEKMKDTSNNTFKIYPADESETDRLVTKALVLGDFDSAVSLCLSSDRFADAILLAVKGGPELLQRTQKAYFERQTTSLPYLRLFQSIVTNDLADIVQNADLQEWQEIFVVLCTFASPEEFAGLAEQLGRRLEFQFTVGRTTEDGDVRGKEFRKNATLTYLAAGRLERLVNIWMDELVEEEKALVADDAKVAGSAYSAHAQALQTFVEKVTVFRSAIKYVDADLAAGGEASIAKEYKLSSLYDRYTEYADILAAQGLATEAVAFLNLTPKGYTGSGGFDVGVIRDRLLAATVPVPPAASSRVPASGASTLRGAPAPSAYSAYGGYANTTQSVLPPAPQPTAPQAFGAYNQPAYNPSVAATTQVAPSPYALPSQPTQPQSGPYAPAQSTAPQPQGYTPSQQGPYNAYNGQNSLTQPPHLRTQPQQIQAVQPMVPPPPPPRSSNGPGSMATPPPIKRDPGGWNDAPAAIPNQRATPVSAYKPSAITSPFPNSQPPPSPGFSPMIGGQALPPPPRPGSVQSHAQLPPQNLRGPPPAAGYAPQGGPAGPPQGMQPPARLMSPPQGVPRQPTPSQYAPPPSRIPGQTPPPQFARPPQGGPPQQLHQGPPGPYALTAGHGPSGPGQHGPGGFGQGAPPQAPQQQQQPGPYGPPPGGQRTGPPPPHAGGGPPPPPPGGPGGPPGGAPAPPRAPPKAAPAAPKYPPGDRSHIPELARPAFNVIAGHLDRLRQTTPPQQKRLVDDLERRVNPLFDALNCETLSKPVVDQLLVLTRAMENNDKQAALAIHVDLLTRGSQTDDIGLWMSGVKQLIMRM